MTNKEAVNWIINLSADIGKSEHRELWHYEQALYEIREILESAQQWIPVTERLPKKYIGEWLCCDKYGNIFILQYENTTPNGDCVFCYTDNDGYSVSVHDVVAWMPLPKTFREGGEA